MSTPPHHAYRHCAKQSIIRFVVSRSSQQQQQHHRSIASSIVNHGPSASSVTTAGGGSSGRSRRRLMSTTAYSSTSSSVLNHQPLPTRRRPMQDDRSASQDRLIAYRLLSQRRQSKQSSSSSSSSSSSKTSASSQQQQHHQQQSRRESSSLHHHLRSSTHHTDKPTTAAASTPVVFINGETTPSPAMTTTTTENNNQDQDGVEVEKEGLFPTNNSNHRHDDGGGMSANAALDPGNCFTYESLANANNAYHRRLPGTPRGGGGGGCGGGITASSSSNASFSSSRVNQQQHVVRNGEETTTTTAAVATNSSHNSKTKKKKKNRFVTLHVSGNNGGGINGIVNGFGGADAAHTLDSSNTGANGDSNQPNGDGGFGKKKKKKTSRKKKEVSWWTSLSDPGYRGPLQKPIGVIPPVVPPTITVVNGEDHHSVIANVSTKTTSSSSSTTEQAVLPPPATTGGGGARVGDINGSIQQLNSPVDAAASRNQTNILKGGLPCDPAPPPFQLAMFGEKSLYTLVLLRHGESEWNSQNLYTGWCDVELTERGKNEAREAGRLLDENGIHIDHAFTSMLRRASFTTNMALNTSRQHWVPVTKTWRLNERHYGALQGYNKDTAYRELGIDQELVMEMRRSYNVQPPMMGDDHAHWHGNDRRYKALSPDTLEKTRGESLKDAADRILPFYKKVILPSLQSGNRCLVVSHANTLRTLIKHIDNISDEDIKGMSIPTGIPLLYRLDENFQPVDPKIELELKYMVEPKGYTWATSHRYGFHGVYLGDLERLQDIQRKRDVTNRDWQRIILRNIANNLVHGTNPGEEEQAPNTISSSADKKKTKKNSGGGGGVNGYQPINADYGVMETRQLWWQIHSKMSSRPEFRNMMILSRMKDHLEDLMINRRQRYLTLDGFESILHKIHLDTEGKVVEPFESLESGEEERAKIRYERNVLELEEECLIK